VKRAFLPKLPDFIFQYLAQQFALNAIDIMAKFQYGPLNRKIFDQVIGLSLDGADFSALS